MKVFANTHHPSSIPNSEITRKTLDDTSVFQNIPEILIEIIALRSQIYSQTSTGMVDGNASTKSSPS